MHTIIAVLTALVVVGVMHLLDERSVWTAGKALYAAGVAGFFAWLLLRREA